MKSVQDIQSIQDEKTKKYVAELNKETEEYSLSFLKTVCEGVHEKLLQMYPSYSAGRILLDRKSGSDTYILQYMGNLFSKIYIDYNNYYQSRNWMIRVYQHQGNRLKDLPGTLDADTAINKIVEIINQFIQDEKNFLNNKRASAAKVAQRYIHSIK